MMELWPFTNFHDMNLDWIVRTVKRLDKDVREWEIGLKNYVLTLLSDHPEWIQNWMLDPEVVAENNRNLAVANLSIDSAAWIHSMPVNMSDNTRRINYMNSLAFDGTYYYEAYNPNTSQTNLATIFKMSAQGLVVDNLEVDIGHASSMFYYEGYLYAADSYRKVYKIDANTMTVDTVYDISSIVPSGEWRGISIEDDEFFLLTTSNIYVLDLSLTTLLRSYTTPTNRRSSKQGMAYSKKYLFIADNYPNTVSVYHMDESTITYIKQFDIPLNINDTMVGEIEGLQVTVKDDLTVEFFFSGVSIVCGIYNNSVFAFNIDPSIIPFDYTDAYYGNRPEYWIDADYTGPSCGSQSMPFKSMCEALAHGQTGRENYYHLIQAASMDNRSSAVEPPRGRDYHIIYESGATAFPRRIQFTDVFIQYDLNSTGWCELAFNNCKGLVNTTNKSDALTNIVVTNRDSDITVTGDLWWSYNVSGITRVTGTCATTDDSGRTAITTAENFTTHTAGINIKGGAQLGF